MGRRSQWVATALALLLIVISGTWLVMNERLPGFTGMNGTTSTAEVNAMDIVLVEQSFEGFTSVRPQGWRAEPGGAYAYAETDIGIVQRKINAPGIGWVQPGVEQDMDFASHAGQVGSVERNGLTWQLYRGSTDKFTVDYALANGGLMTVYFVLMQVPPAQYDALHEALFLRTLARFQPG